MNANILVSSDGYAYGIRNVTNCAITIKDAVIEVKNLASADAFGIFNTNDALAITADHCIVKTPNRTNDRSVRNDSSAYFVYVGSSMLEGDISSASSTVKVVRCHDENYDTITNGTY
jgi:hypothetical protein